MQRKWKKAATAALTGGFIAAQALMQVSAAGGTIAAEMSTRTPVIRVVVPTKMAVAVNEFEMGDAGSQITSGEFTMKNVSEIPVKVEVTSTATLGTNVTLVANKAAAKASTDTAKPAMWLAAVAAVKDNSGTLEYVESTESGANKTAGGVAGTEDNATAFAANKAVQTFYLNAATNAKYKGIIGDETGNIGNGADYYKLTELTPTSDDDAGVAALAATQDVYIAKAGAVAATAPQALIKVEKGTAASAITANWTATTSKVYKIDAAPTAYATVVADNAGAYLYIDEATTATGDAAAFRYVGALSSAKSGWNSIDDLKGISIVYNIAGITLTSYNAVKDDLTYGYKAADDTLTLVNGVLTAKIKIADFKDGTLKIGDVVGNLDTKAGAWGGADDAVTFTFNSTWVNAMKGKTCEVTVNLKDGTKLTASFNVAE